ncbi:hypothetical protein [Pedobacter sp. SL55]|uniref:hypothetical protein n=1 Tax=Pedobacter sp. SL55 TaxID=2995161 RepID=UPI0022706002|nr:hypothetical protein [Pedobacter sp. SL55]WAC41896.1 hypothetical protein OVA16_05925 [Pedobacter sp. SL55]
MKKAFGVLLILLAAFFSLMLLALFINILFNSDTKIADGNTAHHIGYRIGTFIGFGLFVTINFALYFIGIKLLKNKKKELKPIPDEDFPSQLR